MDLDAEVIPLEEVTVEATEVGDEDILLTRYRELWNTLEICEV